jgi:ribosomal protein S18 acetylase RimI-like enzyme
MTDIREAGRDDIPLLYDLYDRLQKKDDGYFEQAFENGCTVLLAYREDAAAGFCLLNWKPRYVLYRRLGIPEIQDINIVPEHRRKGHATALIKWCEGLARAKGCGHIGISVGLTKNYGAAQILYSKLGYVPDGNGVTYDREAVESGRLYRLDDNLALMMLKPL